MSILMLLGVLFGYIAWQRWGPLAGIIVGFLFAGGLAWSILGSILNMAQAWLRFAFNPRMYRQTRPFAQAWEARFGEIRPGREDTKPPPGVFQAWYRAWRETGISAGDWLDAQMRQYPAPVSRWTHGATRGRRGPLTWWPTPAIGASRSPSSGRKGPGRD